MDSSEEENRRNHRKSARDIIDNKFRFYSNFCYYSETRLEFDSTFDSIASCSTFFHHERETKVMGVNYRQQEASKLTPNTPKVYFIDNFFLSASFVQKLIFSGCRADILYEFSFHIKISLACEPTTTTAQQREETISSLSEIDFGPTLRLKNSLPQ